MPAQKKKNDAKNNSRDKNDQNGERPGLFKTLKKAAARWLVFQEEVPRENFILLDQKQGDKKQQHGNGQESSSGENHPRTRMNKKPRPIRRKNHNGKLNDPGEDEEGFYTNLLVDPQLRMNKKYIERIYSLPKNKDIIVRDFTIALDPPVQAFAVFIEGISDRVTVNESVLKPLMFLSGLKEKVEIMELAEYLKRHVVYGNQVDVQDKYEDIIEKINYGGTAVFLDGSPYCLTIETKGWEKRPVGKPVTEQVIRGPHEAFVETLRSNTGLLRKAIRNPHLITEHIKIGVRNKTDVAIMYLDNLVNPSLVEEVRRRINSIDTDYVSESGVLEQFIEDNPFMPVPQVISTERPDRVISFIMDGKVAILMDGNPNVLVVPTTFFSLLHSPEDYYLRVPYGNFIRLLRVVAMFIAFITPSFYVAITTFHQEMIPTDLILVIASSRETVPFPTIIEVFFMEFAFEMIREAGVRVPGVIGNTLGIVGALILGQAAVQAGIVSPILIIVVALTGLASFAIPNYSMSFAFRGVRFIFTALAAGFGFFGVSAGLFILLTSMTSMKSFGVPILSPIGPRTRAGPDIVLRGPVWSMEERPDFLNTRETRRQPDISRGWFKDNSKRREDGGGDNK
ncbi:MAG: spore germination protein [Peptococcaceae bacterium]|jgi:spore germination protein KA|nr:spore germination protein [Peptococcaceae bacterium]MDH7524391.1 spore germination protein [Peptococcaceae bacterium]